MEKGFQDSGSINFCSSGGNLMGYMWEGIRIKCWISVTEGHLLHIGPYAAFKNKKKKKIYRDRAKSIFLQKQEMSLWSRW